MNITQRLVAAYQLWRETQRHFPKKSRFTLGSKIDITFIETIEAVYIASYLPREQKLPFVRKAIGKMDLVKFFLQVAWEAGDLDAKKYASLGEPLSDIGKMLGGWLRNVQNETPPTAKAGGEHRESRTKANQ
ncbi:MAG: four helix bundle protein [bacterium]|nr:four helix bundle protein [bacterium]